MVSAWSDCLSQLYLPHNIKPKDRYTTSQGRPDIYVADSHSGLSLELDIALSHPLCMDVLSRAAWLDRAAASRREELKHKKYAAQELSGGFLPSAIPLVFEHYGRWGEEAQKYLRSLSVLSRDEDGRNNASQFTTYWRQRFSIQLQYCNANVLARKMSRLPDSFK